MTLKYTTLHDIGVNCQKVFIFYLFFFKGKYERLSQSGECGVTSTSVHENCECLNVVGNEESSCKSYCSSDNYCKGYAFATNKCTVYTTGTCRSECNKKDRGITGDLINRGSGKLSGCFKKLGTCVLYNDGS